MNIRPKCPVITSTTTTTTIPCIAGSAPSTGGACAKCQAGTFAKTGESQPCADLKCPAGTTDHDSNPTTPCVKCTVGVDFTDKPGNAGNCTAVKKCKAGQLATFSATKDTACKDCAAGTTDHDSNPRTACAKCTPGIDFTDKPGNAGNCTAVKKCKAGQLATFSATKDTACKDCAAGTTDHDSNPRTACAKCTPGIDFTDKPGNAGNCTAVKKCKAGQADTGPDAASLDKGKSDPAAPCGPETGCAYAHV